MYNFGKTHLYEVYRLVMYSTHWLVLCVLCLTNCYAINNLYEINFERDKLHLCVDNHTRTVQLAVKNIKLILQVHSEEVEKENVKVNVVVHTDPYC